MVCTCDNQAGYLLSLNCMKYEFTQIQEISDIIHEWDDWAIDNQQAGESIQKVLSSK